MVFTLDAESHSLLESVENGAFIGIIAESNGIVSVYHAGRRVSVQDRTFPGHREMLTVKTINATEYAGFSFQMRDGKLTRFYRNSVLNIRKPLQCLGFAEMEDIIEALGATRSDDFQAYP